MQQEVYLDLYFLINAAMDLLCLMLCAALLHRTVKRWRALAAALVGAFYASCALLLGLDGLTVLLSDLGSCLLMCFIAFHSRRTRLCALLSASAVLLLTSMLLGGIMTALYSFLNRLNLPLESLQGDGLSVWIFALLSAVSGFATLRGGRFFGLSSKTRAMTVRVTLFGKEVALRAMVDSGNLLRDPISGRSVIVAELSCLLPILPPELAHAYQSNALLRTPPPLPYAKRLRPIPTSTAAGDALLFAILPDAVSVSSPHSPPTPTDFLIAPVSLGTTACGFEALLPAV